MSSVESSASNFSSCCNNNKRCDHLSTTSSAEKQKRACETPIEELDKVKPKRISTAKVIKQEDYSIHSSITHVELLLNYKFKNPKLCEDALTHSSNTDHICYQTLEFVGDSALGLAITNYLFLNHRDVGPGDLSTLRAANISTEKLARIAVKHKLYPLVRKNSPKLDKTVEEFTLAVEKENEMGVYKQPYGGSFVKAPKVLADIVEAIVGAVYIDCNFNLEYCWTIIRGLLEPIITRKNLEEQQPVTSIYEYCQKKGKDVCFEVWKKENNMVVTNVFVDGEILGIGTSEHQHIARLNAAREALKKVSDLKDGEEQIICNGEKEIVNAKHKLHEMCSKRHWPKPVYSKMSEQGPAHDRTFVASVLLMTPSTEFYKVSDPMSRLKDAENSAAAKLFLTSFNILMSTTDENPPKKDLKLLTSSCIELLKRLNLNICLKRRQIEQVKTSLPVVLEAIRVLSSDSYESERGSLHELFHAACRIGTSIQKICDKLEGRGEELCGILGLYALQVIPLLKKLSLKAKLGENNDLVVSVPPTKCNILHPSDLSKEVAIAYGYNNIAKSMPQSMTVGSCLEALEEIKNEFYHLKALFDFLLLK